MFICHPLHARWLVVEAVCWLSNERAKWWTNTVNQKLFFFSLFFSSLSLLPLSLLTIFLFLLYVSLSITLSLSLPLSLSPVTRFGHLTRVSLSLSFLINTSLLDQITTKHADYLENY